MLLEGIINSHEESWLRHVVKIDAAQTDAEKEAKRQAEIKAINLAQMHRRPMRMSDLPKDYESEMS